MKRTIWIVMMFAIVGISVADTHVGGDITVNTFWDIGGSPYIVDSTVRVRNSATLYIDFGVTVRFSDNTGLLIGPNVSWGDGALSAVGLDGFPIIFEGIADSAGSWKGIMFDDRTTPSVMSFCIVRNGGQLNDFGAQANIYCDYTSTLAIDHCEIQNSFKNSIYLDNGSNISISYTTIADSGVSKLINLCNNSSPDINNCTIIGDGCFYWLYSENSGCKPTITNSDFMGIATKPIRVGPLSGMSGNTFYGHALPGLEILGGDITSDMVWQKQEGDSSYTVCVGNLRVRNDATLIIEPGVVVKFSNSSGLIIGPDVSWGNGALIANGTGEEQIIFTSSVSGSGNWRGIAFDNRAASMHSVMTHCIIENAGQPMPDICVPDPQANIAMDHASNSLTLTHSIVRNSSVDGIYLNYTTLSDTLKWNTIVGNVQDGINIDANSSLVLGGAPTYQNTIRDNGEYNIRNASSNDITATHNYWGSLSDSAAIQATIYDHHDSPAYGYVYFVPWDVDPVGVEHLAIIVNGVPYSDRAYSICIKELPIFYEALLNSGFSKDEIFVLNTFSSLDLDGDLENDVNLPSDSANFNQAFEWAISHSTDITKLFLFIRAHGNCDIFALDEDIISESYLESLIADYRTTTWADEVFTIINSCHSGSLIDSLATPLSVNISSVDANQREFVSPYFPSFAISIGNKLKTGYSFGEAFDLAARRTERFSFWHPFIPNQNPLLDDDGLSPFGSRQPLSSRPDGDFAMSRYLSLDDDGSRSIVAPTPPEILVFEVDTIIGTPDTFHFYAEVNSDIPVDSLWVMMVIDDSSYVIYPEDSTAPIIVEFPIICLEHITPLTFEAKYPDTFSAGILNYIFIAEDTTGDFGELVATDTSASGIHSGRFIPENIYITTHPNPFNSACHISAPDNAIVEIFDINGRRVAEFGGGDQIWKPEAAVGSGVYLVRAKIGDKDITKRVVYLK